MTFNRSHNPDHAGKALFADLLRRVVRLERRVKWGGRTRQAIYDAAVDGAKIVPLHPGTADSKIVELRLQPGRWHVFGRAAFDSTTTTLLAHTFLVASPSGEWLADGAVDRLVLDESFTSGTVISAVAYYTPLLFASVKLETEATVYIDARRRSTGGSLMLSRATLTCLPG